jgi:hypothetical protein
MNIIFRQCLIISHKNRINRTKNLKKLLRIPIYFPEYQYIHLNEPLIRKVTNKFLNVLKMTVYSNKRVHDIKKKRKNK